jgi:MYXO-CTERM domain-containing protein
VLLERPITSVAPVRMPRSDQAADIVAGIDLEIVGYGRTSNETSDVGVMYDAMSAVISINPTELQVGMGSPQPQNCNGDSGGPGFADLDGERRVIGIVSRSFSGGECTMGGVDTRVDAYLRWIHSKVASGIPCGSGLAEPCAGEDPGDEDGGCCSAGGDARGSWVLAFVVGALVLGRRRRASRS